MSIIVLGMEMPKSLGLNVTIYPDGRVVEYLGLSGKRIVGTAVPLPEKHGRLIDADDYAVEMKERQANAILWKEKAARNNDMTTFARGDQAMRTFSEAKLTLDNMETIVEAEGGRDA